MQGPREELRKVGGAALVGLAIALLAVFTPRARLARAESEPLPSAEELTPVPVAAEPENTPPGRPPLAFAATFASAGPRQTLGWEQEGKITSRARLELANVTTYDSTWMETSGYPMGDVPANRGACTDVVVRALRAIDIDLQQLVHDDVAADPGAYGVSAPDSNIDHRRLSTMFTFMSRNAMALTVNIHDKDKWRPGDLVFVAWSWKRGAPAEHVGVISDQIGPRGLPLVIENGGPRPVESDSLGKGKVVGHFRALRRARDGVATPQ